MQAFIVSVVAGCLFPLLPLLAEYGLTSAITLDTWAVTTVIYVAAIGLVSRHQAVLVSTLFISAFAAVIYGAGKYGAINAGRAGVDAPLVMYGTEICAAFLVSATVAYALERFSRHWVEGQPFLEIDL